MNFNTKKKREHSLAIPLSKQLGLSLIELMIAMVLSMFLLGALIQLAISNKQSYNFQQTQAVTQENSRFASYYLQAIVEKAGFMNLPQNFEADVFPELAETTQCKDFKAGQVVALSKLGTGLCIRHQRSDATETDCIGNNIPNDNAITTRIYFDTTTKTLMCGAQGKAAISLVGNIHDIKMVYGLSFDDELDGRSIDTYIENPSDWSKIVGIRFSLLTATDDVIYDTKQIYHFPLDSAAETTAPDFRAYRSTQETVTLRNVVL